MYRSGQTEEVIVIHDTAICYPYKPVHKVFAWQGLHESGSRFRVFSSRDETEELPGKVITPLLIKEV